MKKQKAFLFFGVVVGSLLFIGVARLGARRHDPPPSGESSAQAGSRREVDTRGPSERRGAPLVSVPQAMKEALEREASNQKTELERISDVTLRDNPKLAAFVRLHSKALRTKVEQGSYLEMLKDRELILQAKLDLLTSEPDLSQEGELDRIHQVSYLASALAWKDNPERGYALGTVKEILFSAISADLPMHQRKSLLGDRMELFQYLLIVDPEEAARVREDVAGTPLEQVFYHAESMVLPPSSDERPH